jgi:hypothetical protein
MRYLYFALVLVIVFLIAVVYMDENTPRLSLSEAVTRRIRTIYDIGQALGNRADVFSKVGDSITVSFYFLQPIGEGIYDLDGYDELQPVIDHFSAASAYNSFANPSLAAGVGWAAWGALDPSLADPAACLPGESPLVCEYRATRPAIALIMFGTNDAAYRSSQQYRSDLLEIVRISKEMGVIPILSTIPIIPGYEQQVRELNGVVVEITTAESLPIWNYADAMDNLPNHGLGPDNLHPSVPPAGYQAVADFHPANLQYGYVTRNLTALQMLDMVWRRLESESG